MDKVTTKYYKKEYTTMKKLFKKMAPSVAKVALFAATVSANTTCSWVGYQPKMPLQARKLRKF